MTSIKIINVINCFGNFIYIYRYTRYALVLHFYYNKTGPSSTLCRKVINRGNLHRIL